MRLFELGVKFLSLSIRRLLIEERVTFSSLSICASLLIIASFILRRLAADLSGSSERSITNLFTPRTSFVFVLILRSSQGLLNAGRVSFTYDDKQSFSVIGRPQFLATSIL